VIRGSPHAQPLLTKNHAQGHLCFHSSQAFFPRTSAWDNLKKALKGEHEESVWDHLSGTISAPFEAGEHKQIAVKVEPHGFTAVVPLISSAEPAEPTPPKQPWLRRLGACPPSPSRRRAIALWRRRGFGGHPLRIPPRLNPSSVADYCGGRAAVASCEGG
jgi:hypothetical protein